MQNTRIQTDNEHRKFYCWREKERKRKKWKLESELWIPYTNRNALQQNNQKVFYLLHKYETTAAIYTECATAVDGWVELRRIIIILQNLTKMKYIHTPKMLVVWNQNWISVTILPWHPMKMKSSSSSRCSSFSISLSLSLFLEITKISWFAFHLKSFIKCYLVAGKW